MAEIIPESKSRESVGLNLISESFPQQNTVSIETPKQQEIQPAANQETTNQILDKYTNDELTLAELDEALSKTVIEDEDVKRTLFLTCVLTHTGEEQRNVILTGESSL